MKQEILEYLINHYNTTKWPYVNILELQRKFGKNISDELNSLYQDGYIVKRRGANTFLIELIKFE